MAPTTGLRNVARLVRPGVRFLVVGEGAVAPVLGSIKMGNIVIIPAGKEKSARYMGEGEGAPAVMRGAGGPAWAPAFGPAPGAPGLLPALVAPGGGSETRHSRLTPGLPGIVPGFAPGFHFFLLPAYPVP